MMTVTVKPLTPALAEDFTAYMASMHFDHSPEWAGCYCRFYHMNCAYSQWKLRTAEENRADALEAITVGTMKGFLAYDGDLCIGWLNFNDVGAYLRLSEDLAPRIGGLKTALGICFVVRPEYRRKGVAKALLAAALDWAKTEGYEQALALPNDNPDEPEKQYRGPEIFYDKMGYVSVSKEDGLHVMTLKL